MLVFELNEYHPGLLRKIAGRSGLKALQEIFSWSKTRTYTDDTYDSGYLEPWVQWVSVHTGAPARKHGIKNLGDAPSLSCQQIWERWSEEGRESVVWGVMNGERRRAEKCRAFMPDPWTFSQKAYPEKYQDLIDLPRYLAKNYVDISKIKSARSGAALLRSMINHTYWADFCDSIKLLMRGLRKFGGAQVVFIVFFEHVSAMAFLRAIEETEPEEAILFTNMFAHVQHHYWETPEGENCPQLEFAARAIDDILSKLLTRAPAALRERFCVMNGLSQICTHNEKQWFLHRQKNPDAFVRFLGLNPVQVEPLMTHDAHLTFSTADEAREAAGLLKRVTIEGKPFFHVEENRANPAQIFYRLDFFDRVAPGASFQHGARKSLFHEHFVTIVKRTGRHMQKGEVMANWAGLPEELYNHEVFAAMQTRAAEGRASGVSGREELRN
ncbi:hypothetical protein [Hyphococcus sp.]|uniref:hypothetical protein n=1 Tax=Hyphococcus sp. TaxID=2038636 RepID=UPI003CCBE999